MHFPSPKVSLHNEVFFMINMQSYYLRKPPYLEGCPFPPYRRGFFSSSMEENFQGEKESFVDLSFLSFFCLLLFLVCPFLYVLSVVLSFLLIVSAMSCTCFALAAAVANLHCIANASPFLLVQSRQQERLILNGMI